MSVLVDTSAWIEFLRATGGPHHRWLRDAIEGQVPSAGRIPSCSS